VNDFLQAIALFIPSEVLTLYLSAEAAIRTGIPKPADVVNAGAATIPAWALADTKFAFFACVVLVAVWVVGARYLDDQAKHKPNAEWPIWRVIAGVVAFVVYALGVDTIWLNAPSDNPSVSIATTLLIIFISTILVFVDKLVATKWPNQSATG
jgi:negative regulator of sigma E activity